MGPVALSFLANSESMMVRFFAAFAGGLLSLLTLVVSTVLLVNNTNLFLGAWTMLGAMAAIAAAARLTFSFTRMLALAYGARLMRGTVAVKWVLPNRCRSFSTWLAYDWNFIGEGGRHQGERLLGLEVTLLGEL